MSPNRDPLLMARSDREWTIVQMLYRDPKPVSPQYPAGFKSRSEAWVVPVGLKSHALVAVARWFAEDQSRGRNLHEVHFYPRNYADQYRALTAAGRVIPNV